MYNTQLIKVTLEVLKFLGVPHTKWGIEKHLQEHPFYPSLQSLSDTLMRYQIANVGVRISDYHLEELPLPFFGFVKIDTIGNHDFVGVTEIKDGKVTYFYNKRITIPIEEFYEMCNNGIALLIESDENSSENGYKIHHAYEQKRSFSNYLLGSGLITLILIGMFGFFKTWGFQASGISILSTVVIGLIISIILIVYELDKSNKLVRKVCAFGSNNNCDAVLNSSVSKIFGLSWAEIGLCYFSFQLLYLLTPSGSSQDKQVILSFFSCITALYIPFSLIYQFIVLKQLCKLCLSIQLVLLFQLLWSISWGSFNHDFSYYNIAPLLVCILSPIILWSFLKRLIEKYSESTIYEKAYKKLIRRQDVLELSLSESPQIANGWKELGIIVKGNRNSNNIIINVSNPYCIYCSKLHEDLNNLLHQNNDLTIITLFSIDCVTSDERNIPVRHFLALAELKSELLYDAMDWWYSNENRDVAQFAVLFPVDNIYLERQDKLIDEMREWCKFAEILNTPTLYFNGKKLPVNFDLENLFNLVFIDRKQ